jgi:ABC-type Zn uptake system ZnuABC Zn-binding protein ZnuA
MKGRRPFRPSARGAIALAIALWIAAPARAAERLAIVTTTTDLASLTEAVGGDRVTVSSLVPPQLDPEDYQPRPQDVARLRNARLVVRVGLDFDLWLDKLTAQAESIDDNARNLRRGGAGHVDASFAIATLEIRGASVGPSDGHAHGSGNPHYWLDPKNAEIITATILEALARIDPDGAKTYDANRVAFLAKLEARLQEWQTRAGALKGVPLVAYHNTWAYLARRFRLDFIGFIEPRPGVPPSPAHLLTTIKTMRERGGRVIVREPREPERHVAFIAERTGARIAVLASTVGALPAARDYLSLFDTDIDALAAAAAPR